MSFSEIRPSVTASLLDEDVVGMSVGAGNGLAAGSVAHLCVLPQCRTDRLPAPIHRTTSNLLSQPLPAIENRMLEYPAFQPV